MSKPKQKKQAKPPDWNAFLLRTRRFLEEHAEELPSMPTMSDANMALFYLNHLSRALSAAAPATETRPSCPLPEIPVT